MLADKGYFNGDEIAACEAAGIAVYAAKPATSNSRAQGRFDKDEFICDRESDHYVCPAGQHLTRRMTIEEKGRTMDVYRTSMCGDYPLKSDCTTYAASGDGNTRKCLSGRRRGSTPFPVRCSTAASDGVLFACRR